MTTEDWNTIADQVLYNIATTCHERDANSSFLQIGVTANQCKDQFKPKRSNVRSALQGMFDGM